MTPAQARALCSRGLQPPDVGASELRALLMRREESTQQAWQGTVELWDGRSRRTEMAVRVPDRPLGALIVLHGAGGSGPQVLPSFAALGEELALLCPTAQLRCSNNLELAGLFGKRFTQPRWDLEGDDFPLAALRWARTVLDVDPDRCILAGVSMGGMATWNLGMRFWPSLAAAAPINGALSVWESFGSDRRTRALLPNTLPMPLWVVHGGADEQISPEHDRASVATLRDLGHPDLTYVEVEDGGHRMETLGKTPLEGLRAWLKDKRRGALPAEIHHRAIDDRHGRAYWIGIGTQGLAEVCACRVAPDHFEIEVEGAPWVRLYLTGDGLRPGDLVKVAINGSATLLPFEPDPTTVVTSYYETADPQLVAEQIISFSRAKGGYAPAI